MSWFHFSLLSIFALATAELTQQKLLNQENVFTPRTSGFLTFLAQSVFALILILSLNLGGQIAPILSLNILPKLLLVSMIGSAGMFFYLSSFKVKNISISTIFISFSAVVSTTIGIVIFNESLTLTKFLGIGSIIFAVIILNFRNISIEKNHLLGLLAAICFGVAFSLDKYIIIQNINPLVYISIGFFFTSLFALLQNPTEVFKSLSKSKPRHYKSIIVSAIGYFAYNLFTFNAYAANGEVGKIDAINNSQIFLIILFEFFILKDTKGIFRKLVSAAIAFTGVIILGSI